ncbi:hypothetical protein [Alkalihalobacillus sp. R86527]|uniref:hypothetical protein n=1 Tax=Alkalihalobacillus sp. R86527 TaxID=3093863 RepID=UPI0036716A50
MSEKICSKCKGEDFGEGTDFMAIRPLNKKFSSGSIKIYTFCLNCGEVSSIRIENPSKLRKYTD